MEEDLKKERESQGERLESEEPNSDLEAEIKAGEWQRLREFKTYRQRTRQGKIIATHKALVNRIKQLELLFYEMVGKHPEKSVKLLKEIKRLRFLQEFLLQALIWEERGQLGDHDMPDELEDMI